MRTNAQGKRTEKLSQNPERERRIKKVGKAAHHKPKHRNWMFEQED